MEEFQTMWKRKHEKYFTYYFWEGISNFLVVYLLQIWFNCSINAILIRLTTTNFSITVTKYSMGFEGKILNYQLLFMLLRTCERKKSS